MDDEKKLNGFHSLYKLLENFEVRIPIIQRDYAQGREGEKATAVRERLIEDFVKCLASEDRRMDFNFVYGNTTAQIFYPVDGQQRLTSLYLLHWALACRSDDPNDIETFCGLNAFTYATRNSASEFFALLKKHDPDLVGLIKDRGQRLKTEIVNYPWFVSEWNNDPTVLSALTFLTCLCRSLLGKDCKQMYARLVSENPAVYFTKLDDSSGDNAETSAAIKYIRMNARGKELTTFENVKAMLDSIGCNIRYEKNVIDGYDRGYIDMFYSLASGHGHTQSTLETRTRAIDAKSMAFFRNVYNIAVTVRAGAHSVLNDNDYMNAMYAFSQNMDGKETLFTYYFDLLYFVLDACNKDREIAGIIADVFTGHFSCTHHRVEVACILYLYHLKQADQETMQKLDMLQYVLNNLEYGQWYSKGREIAYAQIDKLLGNMSTHDDAFAFFCSSNYATVFDQADIEAISLPDIQVRLKEQHIKARIITEKKWDYRFFDSLERQSGRRKLQYLLWAANMWKGDGLAITEENIALLEKYTYIAKQYLMSNDLEWRKRFALAGCCGHNGDLLGCEEINGINWKEQCEWDNGYYFWDDQQEPNHSKLGIIKHAYDYESGIYERNSATLHTPGYASCWLKYAVLRNHMTLLANKISYDCSAKKTYIEIFGSKYNFMAQVLLLDRGVAHRSGSSGIDTLRLSEGKHGDFGAGVFISQRSAKIILQADKSYAFSNNELGHQSWRSYTMTLSGTVTVNFSGMPQFDDNMAYVYDAAGSRYWLYRNIIGTNTFVVYTCDLKAVMNNIKNKAAYIENQLATLQTEFSQRNYDNVLHLYRKNPRDPYTNWKHYGGTWQLWTYNDTVEATLVQASGIALS